MNFGKLVEGAVKVRASDIHIGEGAPPYFRVDGTILPLKDAPPTSREAMDELLKAIMPERLRARLEKERGADFSYQHGDLVRLRLVAFFENERLRLVIRLVSLKVPTLAELELPSTLQVLTDFHFGIVLVTGPTGSGKSSTLAALINHINETHRKSIITIEDPIEFVHSNKKSIIAQRQVGNDVPSFNNGLIQAMRQDPDVILVGEMRDQETIRTGLQASETGHLVFSTLHTTTAAQTIDRVINMFPQSEHVVLRDQLSMNLKAVVSQILCRRKEGKGRIAALEIMICTPTIAKLIKENRISDIFGVMKTGESGMQVFDQALANLVRADRISEEEGLRYAHDEFAFRRYVKGVSASSDRGGIIGGFSG
ncbi:MAG: type IV pilus twitching motility protein PilT [Candidatus Sumerlaeia bacterium]